MQLMSCHTWDYSTDTSFSCLTLILHLERGNYGIRLVDGFVARETAFLRYSSIPEIKFVILDCVKKGAGVTNKKFEDKIRWNNENVSLHQTFTARTNRLVHAVFNST